MKSDMEIHFLKIGELFKVKKTVNTLSVNVRDKLKREEVSELINSQKYKVVILDK